MSWDGGLLAAQDQITQAKMAAVTWAPSQALMPCLEISSHVVPFSYLNVRRCRFVSSSQFFSYMNIWKFSGKEKTTSSVILV